MKHFSKKHAFSIIFLIMFLLMLLLNFHVPFMADDFGYMNSLETGAPISGLKDIFISQYRHYFILNGRCIAHFLAQLFLYLPRIIFVIFNSLAYASLGYVIYLHGTCGKKKNVFMLILIYAAMWFVLPEFGETVLWTDGSCNYLWTTLIILTFLLPFRKYMVDDSTLKNRLSPVFMLLGGIIAGWCSETGSSSAIVYMILAMILYRIYKKKIPLWSISGLIGCMIGFIAMISAPGNRIRVQSFEEGKSSLLTLVEHYQDITSSIMSGTFGILLILALFLLVYFSVSQKSVRKVLVPSVYLISFFAASYSLLLSPYRPARAYFSAAALLLIVVTCLISEINPEKHFASVAALTVCLVFLMGISYSFAFIDNTLVWKAYQQREHTIQESLALGQKDIVVHPIDAKGDHCAWVDITEDPNHWINGPMAKYYGADSIRIP